MVQFMEGCGPHFTPILQVFAIVGMDPGRPPAPTDIADYRPAPPRGSPCAPPAGADAPPHRGMGRTAKGRAPAGAGALYSRNAWGSSGKLLAEEKPKQKCIRCHWNPIGAKAVPVWP